MFRIKLDAQSKLFCRLKPVRRISDCIRWYRLWGTWPVRSWVLAAECFRNGDFHDAATHYQAGLAANPRHPAADSARYDLAYCFYRLDQLHKSLIILRSLLKKKAVLVDAYLLCAKIFLILGRALSAVRMLENGLAACPQDARLLSAVLHAAIDSCLPLAEVTQIRERLIRCKAKLSLEDPGNSYLDTALAHYEYLAGDENKGDRMLSRVLASGFCSFESVLLRGERLLALGRVLPARDQLARAMRIAPKDPRPLVLLARSYLAPGSDHQPLWAINLAETACRLSHWQNAHCLSALALAHRTNEEEGKAELFLEVIKKLKSAGELNPTAFSNMGIELRKASNS